MSASTICLRGGRVFDGTGFTAASVVIKDDRISRIVEPDVPIQADEVIDAQGFVVAPGLIDLHFHGCCGHDFCDGTSEALSAIARSEASWGITSICPATMTFPEDRLLTVMKTAARWKAADDEAALVGINMEGPFISPGKIGAQNPHFVQQPNIAMMHRLMDASEGLVKLVDIAPEEAGAIEFIEQLHRDVRISIAHTCATYKQARSAFEAGARQVTHLYNAMPPLHHRAPGPIPAAVEEDGVSAEIITDGIHVSAAMVRLAFQLFTGARMILISDSMMACGMGDGTFELGGQAVSVTDRRATLVDGTLAGSASNLADCLAWAITEADIPAEVALRSATANPAQALGIADEVGSIGAGKKADLVLFDSSWKVAGVILRGRVIKPLQLPA